MNKKRIMMAVGLLVTVGAFYFSTRNVEWRKFGEAFGRFHLIWLLPAFITFYFSMYMRAIRWGLLFQPYYDLKGYQVFRPLMICFGFNNLFPGRVGEFARAIYVGKREKTGVATALATVVAERILDGVTLLSYLSISLWMLPPLDKSQTFAFGEYTLTAAMINTGIRTIIIGCAVLALGVIACLIPVVQRLMIATVERLPLLNPGLKASLVLLLKQFIQGFHALQQPWVLVKILFHTIVLWWLVGVSNWLVALGFGMPMTLTHSMALMTLIGIFIMIPAAPGYWGLYEAGVIFSLLLLGVERNDANSLAYALMIHMLQYLPIVILALIFAWQAQITPDAGKLAEEQETEAEAASTR